MSPYLTQVLSVGDQIELRGPIGGWFVWDPTRAPTGAADWRRFGGGAADGDGPHPVAVGRSAPFRLLYSVRDPASVLFGAELDRYQRI